MEARQRRKDSGHRKSEEKDSPDSDAVEKNSAGTFEIIDCPKIPANKEQGTPSPDTTDQHRAEILDAIMTQTIRAKANELRDNYVRHMDAELSNLLDQVLTTRTTNPPESSEIINPVASFSKPARKNGQQGQLIRKEFVARNSYLTDLFEVPHIQTIQYIFIAVLIFFVSNTIIHDLFDHGTIGVDFHTWAFAFNYFPAVLTCWCLMQLTALLVIYGSLSFWASNRPRSKNIESFDKLWIGIYCLYNILFFILPLFFLRHYHLGPGTASIIVGEQMRFMMKGHAFLRENVPGLMQKSARNEPAQLPSFSKYMYFQFIPTLVYRDSYPMTKNVNWKLVLKHFAQFAGGILYLNYIYLRFCVPVFRNFNQDRVNVETFMKSIFECILPGSLLMFVIFYSMLHAWMNAWAEMLRFADRLFYRDWWNSTTFATYYRTWNIVVHDWLYTYVYTDICKLSGMKCRSGAMFATFLLSAVIHEYILICVLRMFYPVMFVLFAGFGVWMVFVTHKRSSRSWNIVLWLSIFLGQGVLMCLYSSEYYARLNCPAPTTNGILDYIIPRSWSCYVAHPSHNSTSLH